ncbi:MAG TPA: helix-turn-helix domain-containing protein [Candidatus Tetragenococcus pullicola]|nr:helix-turn-helix domain-containing protein [Candidatus Tetragenococcus pullicola]
MVAIGERIKKFRNEKKITQQELSEQLHVSRSAISNWEIGRNYPDLDSVILLSDILEISLDKLLREDEIMVKEVSEEQRKNVKRKRLLQIIIPLFILSLLVTAFLLYQDVSKVHNFFSPSTVEMVTVEEDNGNQSQILEFDSQPYLNFNGLFWKKSIVNHANSDGEIQITIFEEDGQTVVEEFSLNAGSEKELENVKGNTNYIVKVKAAKGSYILTLL